MSKKPWGVFAHSENGIPTGRGYVVRLIRSDTRAEDQYNYPNMLPVRVYRVLGAAWAYAAKLTNEQGKVQA